MMSACFRILSRALLFALLLGGLPRAALMAQNPPTIRTSSSLVLVPVSPLDKSGQFVAGLTERDFELLVDGKAVKLSHLDVVTDDSPSSAPNPQKSAELPPNTFRNISERSANQPNLVILLVDYLNTSTVDRMQLRDELLRFFSTKLKPNEQIAIYGLTHSLVLLQPFTRDSSSLIAIAKDLLKQKGQPGDPKISGPLYSPSADGPPNVQGTDALIEYFTLKNARREYNIDQLQRARSTLAAFRELSESFGGIAGKKTVIWLTGDASPLDPTLLYRIIPDKSVQTPESSWWQMAKTYEALNAAGISVFPVNLRGIVNTGLQDMEGFRSHSQFKEDLQGSQPGDLNPYSSATGQRQGEAAHAVLAMDTVAAETGATVLAGSNDVGELLSRAHKLWANYYVLAFVPERPANDSVPSYHKIKVNVDRRGVHVLARRGYASRPENLISSEKEIQRDLTEAASSPIDLTSVALQLSLGASKDADRIQHIPFSLTVSGVVLGAIADKGAPYDLSIAVLVHDQDGKIRTAVGKRVRDVVPPAEISNGAAKGLKYEAEFQAPAGSSYLGRVIVRDNLSGRIGTVTLALPNVRTKPRG